HGENSVYTGEYGGGGRRGNDGERCTCRRKGELIAMMLVTILSVAFNSEATIRRTIESVFNQTYQNIEYIIIDGQSSDRTVKIAKKYQVKFDQASGRSMTII